MLLVAVDIEGCAPVVVDHAAALARDLGEPALLITAIQHPDGLAWDAHLADGRTVAETLATDAHDALSDLARAFITPVRTEVARGEAMQAVLDAAERTSPRMIVLGTHGRQGLTRWFMGSVAERVLRRSRFPVVVVPAGGSFAHASAARQAVDAEAQG